MKLWPLALCFFAVSILLSCSEQTPSENADKTEAPPTEALSSEEMKAEMGDPLPPDPNIARFIPALRKQYDSVPYYFRIDSTYYFYVIKGKWEAPKEGRFVFSGYRMGLCDQTGKVIIPAVYDKIYNPGGTIANYIEVEINGKRGLYDLKGNQILNPVFESIIPVSNSDVLVQVKKDGQYGWADRQGKTHFDLSSHSDQKLFESPVSNGTIATWRYSAYDKKVVRIIEIYENYEGFDGCAAYVTPSYLADLGFLPEYRDMLLVNTKQTGDEAPSFYMDSVSANVTTFADWTNNLKLMITDYYTYGIQARPWESHQNNLLVVDRNFKVLSNVLFYNDGNNGDYAYYFSYSFPQRDLLEVVTGTHNWHTKADKKYPYDYMPKYTYYKINPNGSVDSLSTSRIFAYTKYVKISERYFKGIFANNVDAQDYNMIRYEHLSIADLELMKNEIFAEYGFKFKTERWKTYFESQSWYKPLYDNVDDRLTEIDKHNIKIITGLIEKMKGHESEYIKLTKETYSPAG